MNVYGTESLAVLAARMVQKAGVKWPTARSVLLDTLEELLERGDTNERSLGYALGVFDAEVGWTDADETEVER